MSCTEKAFAEKSNFLYEVTKDYYKLFKKYFTTIKIRLTVPSIVTIHLKIALASGIVIDILEVPMVTKR